MSNASAVLLNNVSKHYASGASVTQVLDRVSLDIPRGVSTAIVGPSGSGKSTLLALITGLDTVSSGEIRVLGQPISGWSEAKLANFRSKHVGIVFQSYRLIPHLTALENAALPLEIQHNRQSRDRAIELLDQLGLSHRLHHYPSQLSGGEQQRVAVARAVIHQPEMIIADEPTGNLDSKSGGTVMDLLIDFSKSSTLVMVTHDHDLAQRLDQRIHVRDGHVVIG